MPILHTRDTRRATELLILKGVAVWRGDCFRADVTKFSQGTERRLTSTFKTRLTSHLA